MDQEKAIENAAPIATLTDEYIFSISELNHSARHLLEAHFCSVWVQGEVSNFSAPRSGHWYFSLKDENAQIRCALFKRQLGATPEPLEEGEKILACGRVSLYEPRGDYQLILDRFERLGEGALQRQFEALKKKLAVLGLFASERKKPLPAFPQTVGIITSPTGAAIRDILTTLQRRAPFLRVIIYPSQVQGDKAAAQLVQALTLANHRQECNVLILARGGGSLEDLWPFNDEALIHTIARSQIPIVSGVGHEVDCTLCDFAADYRAATPTAAAEAVSPDGGALRRSLQQTRSFLENRIKQQLEQWQLQVRLLERALKHPKDLLQARMQMVDQLEQRFVHRMQTLLAQRTEQLHRGAQTLNALSPLQTLNRGYAIVTTEENQLLQAVKELPVHDVVKIRMRDGQARCKILEILATEMTRGSVHGDVSSNT